MKNNIKNILLMPYSKTLMGVNNAWRADMEVAFTQDANREQVGVLFSYSFLKEH